MTFKKIYVLLPLHVYGVTYSWALDSKVQGTQDHKTYCTLKGGSLIERFKLAVEVASLGSSSTVFHG